MKGKIGRELFEIPNLIVLNKELEKYGKCLTTTWHMFLPKRKFPEISVDEKAEFSSVVGLGEE